MRAIPLATRARTRLKLDPVVDPSGRLDARDAAAARRIAARMGRAGAAASTPGELLAMAALGSVLHELVERERRAGTIDLGGAVALAEARVGTPAARAVEGAWRREYATKPPAGAADDLAAELLVVAALNDNDAVEPVRELIDDRPLRRETPYEAVVDAIESALGGRGAAEVGAAKGAGEAPRTRGRRARLVGQGRSADATADDGSNLPLPARLREPMRRAPTSLRSQLEWVRDHWGTLLAADPALRERVALALDVIAEEARAAELAAAAGTFGGPRAAEAPEYRGLDAEPEAFSADTEWMPSVVLMAKSTYVWLEQLSRTFGRSISNLADVPDEELDRLAGLGVTGLWLIGLWQRSAASAEIKRRRGDVDAVASAYAIDEYRIADDLGGEAAFANLRDRAGGRGIRMAADMVPNHMGLDSRWLIEHPERFIQLDEPPFPAYSFEGPNLSPDERVELRIEDHYWEASDAAVVFQRRQARADGGRPEGETRYVYHGNDGTAFPWNDTAQLDYLQPEVREAVIGTILDVARRAPIIRFDAAMVLARRHIRRLWYPRPGEGGAIPSRAEHAISDADFARRMPHEFWREVVDRVAAEAPGTLLLAEAFWLLEGYFVRTLGMHRVYNSAFMHMLRDEDNAGYRRVIKDTLEFDPRVLQRFVNFMTNPDERPAAEQFGTGDKAFAAATLLATLPGLPMLGHGQVEGWRERYGMEFRKARWDEPPGAAHRVHFEQTIVPLLRRRADFAGTETFHFYDARADDGSVLEDVYAFSNGRGNRRTLVLVHNRHASASVTIDHSAGSRPHGGRGRLVRTRLADDLGLGSLDPAQVLRFRDERTGWEQLRTAGELRDRGLPVELGPYEARVLDVEVIGSDVPAAPLPGAVTPGTASGAAGEPSGARSSLDDLPAPARTGAQRFLEALHEILGDDLLAAWVHGGTTFADRPARPGDLDLEVVVGNVSPDERLPARWFIDPTSRPARLRAARLAIEADLGVTLDVTFVRAEDAGLGGIPSGAFDRRRREETWAVMRAHWHAGQYAWLWGPAPETLVPPPTPRALRMALERELEHLERHVADGDDDPYEATYAIWNGARILRTLATGDAVISKRSAGEWALRELPARWQPVIRAAGRAYDGADTEPDRRELAASMAPWVRMVRRRFEAGVSGARPPSRPRSASRPRQPTRPRPASRSAGG